MNKIKNHSKELIVLTILLAVAVSVVNAAVFVYYPMEISATWVRYPIKFEAGSNAGKADIDGTITVSLDDGGTTATITVHPSRRGTTRYKDILRIVNNGTQAYYVGFANITDTFDAPISTAKLLLYNATNNNYIGEVDLMSTGWQGWKGSLNTGQSIRVDLLLKISAGSTGSDTAKLSLVYSPQSNESPP
ncbi:MAG: hypothetical protein QXR97_06905 [Thermoproteota archaeon]